MKLKDGTEVALVITDHSYRTADDEGFPDFDLVEVGSIYHRPLVKDCNLTDEQCPYERHLWEIPACAPDSDQDGVLVRQSIAHHVSEPCPKPECFGRTARIL